MRKTQCLHLQKIGDTMELANTMDGQTPYITNLPIYSTAAINNGSLIVASIGTAITDVGYAVSTNTGSGNVADAAGCNQVSTVLASAAQENLAFGGQSFNIDTDGIPNRGLSTGGTDYLPVLLSPGATWFGRYDQTTSTTATVNINLKTITASNTTNVIFGICGSSHNNGSWAYSLADVSAGTATFSGQVRQIANSAATTSFTMLTAWQVSTDSEAVVTYGPAEYICTFSLNGTADIFGTIAASAAVNTASRNDGAAMCVLANMMKHDAAPIHRLTQSVDDGLDGITGGQVYSEVVFLDNYWNNGA